MRGHRVRHLLLLLLLLFISLLLLLLILLLVLLLLLVFYYYCCVYIYIYIQGHRVRRLLLRAGRRHEVREQQRPGGDATPY